MSNRSIVLSHLISAFLFCVIFRIILQHNEKETLTNSQVQQILNISYKAGYYSGAGAATSVMLNANNGDKASVLINQEFKKDSIVYYNRWKSIVEE